MKIRYSELTSGSKSKAGELKTQEISTSSDILFGRGGRSAIILHDRSVSLEHAALFEISENKLGLRDLGSLSGTRVNGQLQKNTTLSPGDIFTLGLYDFKVLLENGSWVILSEKKAEANTDETKQLHERLNLARYVPSTTLLSVFFIAFLLAVYVVRPYFRPNQIETHSVGPLTSHHAFLGSDCKSCHSDIFKPASDASCQHCHSVPDHYKSDKYESDSFILSHSKITSTCITCHSEHKGIVTSSENKTCTSCHSGIEKSPKAELKNVSSWEQHPEFKTPTDPATIKFNHAVHLKEGIEGDKGRETLTCINCHMNDVQGKYIQPITYENQCARCHSLEFDKRFPGMNVPHGNVQGVHDFLEGVYTKLALQEKSKLSEGELNRLKKPTVYDAPEFIQKSINKEVKDTEEMLFSKTGCQLCHGLEQKESHFEIKKVAIHNRWYTKSIFAHKPHGQISCETCHGKVKDSKDTSDVLMPKKDACAKCHAGTEELSSCITCHDYHEKLSNPQESQK